MSVPTVGQIVIYRNRSGVDMPAIVTALDDDGLPFLHCFPPPGAGKDLMEREWGVAGGDGYDGDMSGLWRWPERA